MRFSKLILVLPAFAAASMAAVVRVTIQDRIMSADCVRHAQMFFDRPDLDLEPNMASCCCSLC
jgi:hypothetical protein